MARYFLSGETVTHGDLVALLDEHREDVAGDLLPSYRVNERLGDHHSDIQELQAAVEALRDRVASLEAQIAEYRVA